MTSCATLRRELLRLVKARHDSAWINTKRISAFYNVPEKSVRRELAKLADEKIVNLSGWDGSRMRPYFAWQDADAFVDTTPADAHFHVDLIAHE